MFEKEKSDDAGKGSLIKGRFSFIIIAGAIVALLWGCLFIPAEGIMKSAGDEDIPAPSPTVVLADDGITEVTLFETEPPEDEASDAAGSEPKERFTLLSLMHELYNQTGSANSSFAKLRSVIFILLLLMALIYLLPTVGIFYAISSRSLLKTGRRLLIVGGVFAGLFHLLFTILLAYIYPGLMICTVPSLLLAAGLTAAAVMYKPEAAAKPAPKSFNIACLALIPLALIMVTGLFWKLTDTGSAPPVIPTHDDLPPMISDTDDPDNPNPSTKAPTSGNRKDGVYTFILAGIDKVAYHTDTLMVASFDTVNGKLDVVNIPRDTMVNVKRSVKKINGAYGSGMSNGGGSAGGVAQMRKELKTILGFTPDYYLMVDLKAFEELVDAIDGIDFDVPRKMNYDDDFQNLHIHLNAGFQHLTGAQALGMVRWRKNNDGSGYRMGDTGRIELTQVFLKELARQASEKADLKLLSDVVSIAGNYAKTDIAEKDMLWFGDKLLKLEQDDIRFATLPVITGIWYKGGSYVHVDASDTVALVNERLNPYKKDITIDDLDLILLKD